MTIFRCQHDKNYTSINNFIVKDRRLSWKAKAIWLYAFSRPDDWSFNLEDIVNQSTDGKDSVNAGLKELENCGYLLRCRFRDSDGKLMKGADWCFYEIPQPTDIPEPKTENPILDNPTLANPPLLSTEAILSTEKQQQQQPAAVCPLTAAVCPIIKVFDCLASLDIPYPEAIWLSQNYDEQTVINAVGWAVDPGNPPQKSLAASIKFACKMGLSFEPKKAKEKLPEGVSVEEQFANKEIARKFRALHWENEEIKFHLQLEVNFVKLKNDSIYYDDLNFKTLFDHSLRKNFNL